MEEVLIHSGHAKACILYCVSRSRMREMKSGLMNVYEELTFRDARDNDLKRENTDIDGDTATGTITWDAGRASSATPWPRSGRL